jgi:hypothetical protein
LVARSFICSFCIAHSIFISMLRFCFGLIQPLAFSLFMCECGHKLDESSTHLTRCPFGGQWITTHDTIRNVMYALAQKSGHITWKQWYTLMSRVSL